MDESKAVPPTIRKPARRPTATRPRTIARNTTARTEKLPKANDIPRNNGLDSDISEIPRPGRAGHIQGRYLITTFAPNRYSWQVTLIAAWHGACPRIDGLGPDRPERSFWRHAAGQRLLESGRFLREIITTIAMVSLLVVFIGFRHTRPFTPGIFPILYAIMVPLEAAISGTSTNPAS